MKLRMPLLSILALISASALGCVVHSSPPPSQQPAATGTATTPAPTPTAAPTAAPTTAPTAAPTAPAADDPNAEIPADSEDPAAVAAPLPQQQPVESPPVTPGLAEETAPGIAEGKPTGIEPGAPAAFWIWRNALGVWKLRTTTAKKLHHFRGRVKGVQKPIGIVKPSRTEFGDRIKRGTGGEVIFGFSTMGHVDGFDFRAPKDACVRFDLQLDTGATAKKVIIGKNATSPKTHHFILCPPK